MKTFFEKYPLEENVIAAGVSGGADSLALVLRLKEWADENDKKVVALTVNHHLRPESTSEALYVAQLMNKFGIEHHILSWEGEKPQTGIEEAAREARYALLKSWCDEHKVGVLATGHHLRDQAETFLLRLIRGSGVSGLSGILPVSYRWGIKIVRPQLFDKPEFLKDYLSARNIVWVEDASNQNEDFLRVKIRHFLPLLSQNIGLSEERLAATAAIMERTRSFLEAEVQKFLSHSCKLWANLAYSFSLKQFLQLHEEMQYQVLSYLLKTIGNKSYVPEASEVLRLCSVMHELSFKGATLSGCEIIFFQNKIWIIPERKNSLKITKKNWDDFLEKFPLYRKYTLPYKFRCILFADFFIKHS